MKTTELVVIGSGPGGLAATAEAVSHGISVMLFDNNPLPGGQYFVQSSPSFYKVARTAWGKDGEKAASLFQITTHPLVCYMPNTVFWGSFEDKRLAYVRGADSGHIHSDCIIIAAGAYDRPVPFPGWTLPGVITAGGVLHLIKNQRIVPGHRILITGNGPLLLVLAYYLYWAGTKVAEVLETSLQKPAFHELLGLFTTPSLLYKGLIYRTTMMRAGIPLRRGEIVLEAHGKDRVAEVVVAPIDSKGQVNRLRSRSIKVDTLALGYGFTPSVEIARLLGCDLYYHPLRGDWIPRRSDDFETSIPGVFAVGDCADIGGSEIALIEGRLAGLAAAVRLGRCNETEAERIGQTLRGKLNQLYRVRSIIDRIYVPPPLESFLALLTENTIVCRCEEVTAGQLWEKLRKGVSNMNEMKALTRIGMGRCQGRNCLGTLAALLAQKLEYEPNNLVMPRARPPARPIRIGDLLHEPLPPPVPPELKLP